MMRKSNIIVEGNSEDENVENLAYPKLLFDVMLMIFLFIINPIYTSIY